jgi:hypothetical protein
MEGVMPAGRPKVHLENQLAKGRLSKKRQAERVPKPVKLGSPIIHIPLDVEADPVALAKWAELRQIYKGKNIISSSDTGMLARYCLLCIACKKHKWACLRFLNDLGKRGAWEWDFDESLAEKL